MHALEQHTDGTTDSAETIEQRAAKLTPADVADAVEQALRWLPISRRDEARSAPASQTLAKEFKRAGAVMRRALKKNGPVACMSAIQQYEAVTAALKAARRIEHETPTDNAADPAQPLNIQTHTGTVHAPGRYDKVLRTTAPKCCASRSALLRYHYLTPVQEPVTCNKCLAALAKESK